MKKILFVLGTRPEAIKMAPVIRQFIQNGEFEVVTCNTGQHSTMLDQVIEFFDITIDYNLKVMIPGQSLAQLTTNLMVKIDQLLGTIKPDLVFVHGDTTTSFVAALTSFYHQIKVAHVEAGLRTYNKWSPFPEELNRTFNGHISDIHFAPTSAAVQNLKKAGIQKKVVETGNTVIDALQLGLDILKQKRLIPNWANKLKENKKLILVTQHRRENFGKGLSNVLDALLVLANRNDVQVVFPVHLNPKVQQIVYEKFNNNNNILLLSPLPYPELIWIMSKCYMIITDSGGIQEEAPTLNKPFLVTRDTTERPEAIDSGAGVLVGTDYHRILSTGNKLLNDKKFYNECSKVENPYGDGLASNRILQYTTLFFNGL
jgi:UDP-N-acetylglucosamine 2-epimerase (non-hydrolysing)